MNEKELRSAVSEGIRHIGIGIYSSGKIREYLTNKGFDHDIASAAVTELVERGYIDDMRAGRKVLNSRTGKKQESKRMLYQRMIAAGVSSESANIMLSECEDDHKTCLMLYESLIPDRSGLKDDPSDISRAMIKKALARGYSYEVASNCFDKWFDD